MSVASLDWEDCTGQMQVGASIAKGDGYWPCLVSVDGMELNGSITADDCRSLSAMLLRAAEECDACTERVSR